MFRILSQRECTADKFVDFWSAQYSFPNEDLYTQHISKSIFSREDLKSLFLWKNGMRLSGKKDAALNGKVLRRLTAINELKTKFLQEQFDRKFTDLSAIWKIFLLHCVQPQTYPIFDQHVYRAMCYMQSGVITELRNNSTRKYKQYFESYVPFYSSVVKCSCRDSVKVDRALWVFGKTLKDPLAQKVMLDRNGIRLD
jgi:hypothetical protein